MTRSKGRTGKPYLKLRQRVLRTETHCAICGQWVDQTLPYLDPMAPQVDHIVPLSRGGAPLDRGNAQLTHRVCNNRKYNGDAKPVTRTSRQW